MSARFLVCALVLACGCTAGPYPLPSTDFLVDHFEGTLPKAVAEEFEDHLSICPDCRTYLRNYRETIRLAREAEDEIPPDVPPELVEAVVALRQKIP